MLKEMYELKMVYLNMISQLEGFSIAGQVHANGPGNSKGRPIALYYDRVRPSSEHALWVPI